LEQAWPVFLLDAFGTTRGPEIYFEAPLPIKSRQGAIGRGTGQGQKDRRFIGLEFSLSSRSQNNPHRLNFKSA